MNIDLSVLKNMAQLFGSMPNDAGKQAERQQNTSQNAENRRDRREDVKIHAKSSFVAQNGLYEQVDVSSFENNQKSNGSSAQKQTSPIDNILTLMNKKSDLDKMMPAFANIFSKAKTQNVDNQKEKSKPKDLFGPIEFAGYTVLSALNRLYFGLKN